MKRSSRHPSAFSLLELLIAVAIVSIVALLAVSASGYMRQRSQSLKCVQNLRQIGVATTQYAAEHRNELPYYFYLVNGGTDTGSGAGPGTWFYNLAPYLNIPRTEVSGNYLSEERTYIGQAGRPFSGPCVFTCPGHKESESQLWWTPHPMSWPTRRPVSYAPPLEMRGDRSARGPSGWRMHRTGVEVYPVFLTDIQYPSQKIWITDSPGPNVLNVIPSRWTEGSRENWARQAFSRHQNGGNALFYDGHVQWFPITAFTESPIGPLEQMIRLYFHPYRAPELDL